MKDMLHIITVPLSAAASKTASTNIGHRPEPVPAEFAPAAPAGAEKEGGVQSHDPIKDASLHLPFTGQRPASQPIRSSGFVAFAGATAVVAALALPLSTMNADAATGGGEFAARGLGALKCKAVLLESDGSRQDVFTESVSAWIDGYISAGNRLTVGAYDVMPIADSAALARLAISICRANPDEEFERTIEGIVEAFKNGSISGKSAPLRVHAGKGTVTLRRAVLHKTQEELVKKGFLENGTADGKFGPATRRALVEFQRSVGAAETGLPDAETLARLFAMGVPTETGSLE